MLVDVQLPVIPYEWSDMPVPKNPHLNMSPL